MASHPDMTISSGICQDEEVMQCLEQGSCDFAILPFPFSMPGKNAGIQISCADRGSGV